MIHRIIVSVLRLRCTGENWNRVVQGRVPSVPGSRDDRWSRDIPHQTSVKDPKWGAPWTTASEGRFLLFITPVYGVVRIGDGTFWDAESMTSEARAVFFAAPIKQKLQYTGFRPKEMRTTIGLIDPSSRSTCCSVVIICLNKPLFNFLIRLTLAKLFSNDYYCYGCR